MPNCSKESKLKYNKKMYSQTAYAKKSWHHWTEGEINLIKDPSILDRDLCEILNRSLGAIQKKRCSLRKEGHIIPSKGTQQNENNLNFSDRYKARQKLKYEMRTGRIREKSCQLCGSTEDINAHHEDYTRPLDVTWLCRECHLKLHNEKLLEERGR